jgi:hypothetical protein
MASYELELDFYISIEGSKEFVEELRDRIEDLVYEALNINCGEPECCPEPRGENYVPSATGSTRINKLTEEDE